MVSVLHMGSPKGLFGAERWILALIRHLPAARVESIVGVVKDEPGPGPELCAQAARLGFETRVFEAPGRLSLAAIGQMRRFVRERGIDIVHTHGYKSDVIGFLATRGTNCRIVSTPHGWSTSAGLKLQVYEALDRIVFRFLDLVVPLSEDLYAGLRTLPGLKGKVRLIANGVDLSEVDSVGETAAELQACRTRGEAVVGYIGQLIARKSVDTLLRAFAGLRIERKRLYIVGDGPERPALERLAGELGVSEHVCFTGFRDDRIALLKGFDALVLPSKLEGIPRCVLEAMAAGVPVLATDIPGNRDVVLDRISGLLFQVGDHDGLAGLLGTMLSDAGLRASIVEAGQRLVRASYSAQAMAEAYERLYAELAGR